MDSSMRSWVCGVGVGAGLVFLLDPTGGARRRALIRDKVVRASRKTRHAVDTTGRDLGNRMTGLMSGARVMFENDTADDRVIEHRVRTELGRITSHPRAIAVCADDAVVTLTGDVLASDVSGVLRGAAGVRGVNVVQNNMTVHQSADGIPALQGSSRRPDQWTTWLREGWSPSAMLLAGTATAAAAIVTAVAVRRAA